MSIIERIADHYNRPCGICGMQQKHKDWWTCKSCTKKYSAKEYNELLLEYTPYIPHSNKEYR